VTPLWAHYTGIVTPAVRERVLAVLIRRKDPGRCRSLPKTWRVPPGITGHSGKPDRHAGAARHYHHAAAVAGGRRSPRAGCRGRAIGRSRRGRGKRIAGGEACGAALEALQRDALKEVDRRVKAYQDSQDVLRIVDRTREALAAIAAKRK